MTLSMYSRTRHRMLYPLTRSTIIVSSYRMCRQLKIYHHTPRQIPGKDSMGRFDAPPSPLSPSFLFFSFRFVSSPPKGEARRWRVESVPNTSRRWRKFWKLILYFCNHKVGKKGGKEKGGGGDCGPGRAHRCFYKPSMHQRDSRSSARIIRDSSQERT